jgi:hypothetical protein
LPVEFFSRHPDAGRQHWCKACFKAYFGLRGQRHREQSKAAKRRRQQRARQFIHDYLSDRSCADCGEGDRLVLEFDHVVKKLAGVSGLVHAGWSIKRLQEEIGRCEVVCVNCHRRRTASRSPSWRISAADIDDTLVLLPAERRNLRFVRASLLSSACVDCGIRDLLVLEFDHVGSKRGAVGLLARRGCSLERLKAEIAECEVRCANCHRRRTILSRRGRPKLNGPP